MKRQTMSVLKCHKSHLGRAQSNSSLCAKLGLVTAPTDMGPKKREFRGREKASCGTSAQVEEIANQFVDPKPATPHGPAK